MSAPEPTPTEFAETYRSLVWKLAAMQLRSRDAVERVALDELITYAQKLEGEAKKAAATEVSA